MRYDMFCLVCARKNLEKALELLDLSYNSLAEVTGELDPLSVGQAFQTGYQIEETLCSLIELQGTIADIWSELLDNATPAFREAAMSEANRVNATEARQQKCPVTFEYHDKTGDPDYDLLTQLRRTLTAIQRVGTAQVAAGDL